MGLLALVLAVSAFLLWVVLPQGYFAARLLWLSIHKWTGLALSVTVILHVLLHWRWLVRMTRRALGRFSEQDVARFRQPRDDPDRMCPVDRERRQFW
jgi:cytochrome b subunit of formate dehydrogenase